MPSWDPRDRALLMRTTLAKRSDAEGLARRLVEARLAACVHVTETTSVYRWDGAVQTEPEFVVEARTRPRLRARLEAAMLDGHPYKVPMVEVVGAYGWLSGAYARWFRGELA